MLSKEREILFFGQRHEEKRQRQSKLLSRRQEMLFF